jgi:hypothetical protein
MAYLPPPSIATPPGDVIPAAAEDDGPRQRRDHKTRFMDRVKVARHEILRGMLENCLFYLGLQWLQPLPDGRGFTRANLRRDVPRPVTNRFKAILDAIDAPLSRLEPALTVVPGSDKDDDRMTADLAMKVLDYVYAQVDIDRLKGELSKILVLCNNAYAHAGQDPSGGGTIRVPQWACEQCGTTQSAIEANDQGGVCKTCGGPLRPSKTAADTVNEGALFLEAKTPFETWTDYGCPRMEDQPCVLIRTLRPRATAEAMFPDFAAQIRGLPAATSTSDIGLTFLQSIIRVAPGGAAQMGGIGFGAPLRWQESVIDDLFYVKPCAEFPEGFCQRMLGDELEVDVKPLGQVANDGTPEEPGAPFIPVFHYQYDNVPGTHIATGPADHLKDLQRQRNRREAAIELYFQRSANGIWLIPEGTDVQTPSGEEGWVMRYSPLGSSGAKPERVEGSRLPSSFVEWLQFTDKQMEDIAGTYDLFRGERPPNVSSGYAMQILTERAQARFAHVYANYEVAHAALGKGLFLLFRQHAPATIYVKIRGEDDRWAVRALERADLRGGVDIRVESGSARPKSTLEKKAAAEQTIALGIVDLLDPDVRYKLLNLYGVPELMASTKADDEQIRREHAIYLAWVQAVTDPQTGLPIEGLTPEQMMLPVLVDALLDDHPLHGRRHRIFQLSPEFLGTPDWARKAFREGHYLQHLYEEQMDMMTQAMQPAPPAPPGPPGAGNPPGQGGGGANAGNARAQGQATTMQNGGEAPGPGGQRQQRDLRDALDTMP